MEINELPSPRFTVNESGMISVFLPSFEGEPGDALLTKKDETTLHFRRSDDSDVFLTEIEPEVMEALHGTEKILVIETNIAKSIKVLENALNAYAGQDADNPDDAEKQVMDTIDRAYEISVRV